MPRYSREDEYEVGYRDGYDDCMSSGAFTRSRRTPTRRKPVRKRSLTRAKPRKLSVWQKYLKNKRNHIKFKSGKDKGKLNLKAMGRAYRKKKKR